MKLSIIIPVYNEKNTILEILKKVDGVDFGSVQKEIIIVDDCSTDGTRKIIEDLSGLYKTTFHSVNQGKGSAIRTGLKVAAGDYVVIQDADLEYDPNDYVKLLKPISDKKSKVVYGSRLKTLKLRFWGKNKTPLPFHYLANFALSLLTNLIYSTNLTDMETGYKMFTRQVYKKLKITEHGFAIEPELTAKIAKLGYKIYEVPIKTKPRSYKEGKKITFWDAIGAVIALVKYRLL